jgi:hypothetical protein
MVNQALEQTRGSVLRCGVLFVRELLNLFVLRQVRLASGLGSWLAFQTLIAVDLWRQ